MKKIGLTGGIGSGKSTVAKQLAAAGFPVVDADQLAREIVEPGQPALARLVEAFGDEILAADGSLNRAALAERAFATQEGTDTLNSITHPAIRELTDRRFAEAEEAGVEAVIYDMPLLVDLGLDKGMDFVVVVSASEDIRIQRLAASRGVDEADARRRMAAQIDEATRNAAADVVIDNNGGLDELGPQVDLLIEKISSWEPRPS